MRNVFSAITLSLAAAITSAPLAAHAERVQKVVPDYTVFVDPPSGFVFVKLPQGWKFVGAIAPEEVPRLPIGVETALLVGEDDDEDMARMASQRSD
jgi:hypothetical protein